METCLKIWRISFQFSNNTSIKSKRTTASYFYDSCVPANSNKRPPRRCSRTTLTGARPNTSMTSTFFFHLGQLRNERDRLDPSPLPSWLLWRGQARPPNLHRTHRLTEIQRTLWSDGGITHVQVQYPVLRKTAKRYQACVQRAECQVGQTWDRTDLCYFR